MKSKLFKIAFVFAFVLLNLSNAFAQPSFVKDSLDKYIERAMQTWNVPGIAVCIVKDGKVVVSKGYGYRNVEKKLPVTDQTLFQIASNSKAFTGTALAMLEKEGKLKLDDKVTSFMPWFKLNDDYATKEVTVRDLLCHRIGLKTFQGDFLNWGSNLSRRDIMNKMSTHKLQYPFRYKYGYCNGAFLTAGEIIPLVADTSWDDFLKYRFFKPLKMNRTSSFYQNMLNDSNACIPYTLVNNKLTILPLTNIDNLGPAASISSCVNDMANWLLLQLDSGRFNGTSLIPFSAIQETRKPQILVNQLSSMDPSKHFSAYGLGWELSDYHGRKIIEHDGGANGFVTGVGLVPEENLGVVVLTNTDANWIYDGIRKQIIDAYLNVSYRDYNALFYSFYEENVKEDKNTVDAYEARVNKMNTLSTPLSNFVGSYVNEVYGKMEIKVIDKKIFMFFEHHPNNIGKLDYMDGDKFRCTYSDVTCGVKEIPFVVKNGIVDSCSITVNDFIDYMPYTFIKLK